LDEILAGRFSEKSDGPQISKFSPTLTSLRLTRYFGFSPEYWFNKQAHYGLEVIRRQSIAKIERDMGSGGSGSGTDDGN
jgi:hypothetical protein